MNNNELHILLNSNIPNVKSRLVDIFKSNLRYLRHESGLTQKQIAEKLDIAESTYANWEQGRREPSISDIFNLLYVLDINANDLFDVSNTIRD